MRAVTVVKQAADLHTATVAQRATARLLSSFDFNGHLARLRVIYGERCTAMLEALERHMPVGTRWTVPEGGMFVWAELPRGMNAQTLFPLALEKRVAFVPGAPFFAGEPRHEFMRLNFSNRPPELLDEGMRRLGAVIASQQ